MTFFFPEPEDIILLHAHIRTREFPSVISDANVMILLSVNIMNTVNIFAINLCTEPTSKSYIRMCGFFRIYLSKV